MKTTTIIIACLLTVITINAQTFEWAKSFGSIYDDESNSITVDASGNVYTTGYYKGTVDFDPGVGTANIISNSTATLDFFVQKMDSSGNFVWVKSFGSNSDDVGNAITADALGNIYITGSFRGTVDFDPGAGTANLTSAGIDDIFVLKMDASGNFIWAKSFGDSDYDIGKFITADASGNVYTTGYFQGTVDFDPGVGTTNLTSAGFEDVFVLKMDASGNFVWAKSFGTTDIDFPFSMTVDASGNVYTTGYFKGTGDYNPGAGTATLTSAGAQDIFVQKMDASGNFVWAKSFGSTGDDVGFSITVNASGNVYTTGSFKGTVDLDPGVGTANLTSAGSNTWDIFVQKMDASGNFVWAKSFGSNNDDRGKSITVDASGNVYTTGSFQGTVDFDPGPGTANLTAINIFDVFIQKLDASGNFVWAKSFGEVSDDFGNSITLDASGNIYTTGGFQGTVDFDPGAGTANLIGNLLDVFIHKMSQVTTGVYEIEQGIQIAVYPNPSNGLVQISFKQALNNVAITVTDLQGKVVFSKQLDAVLNEQIQIDGSAGIYFLSVKTSTGQSVVKLIKE